MASESRDTSASREGRFGLEIRKEFPIDPNFIPLNHAYGSYPKCVEVALKAARDRIEHNPDRWVVLESRQVMDSLRETMAPYLRCPVENLVFVPNTTFGVNSILRSIHWARGDKILHLSTVYRGVRSTLESIVETSSEKVTLVEFTVIYPITDETLVRTFQSFVKTHHHHEGSRIRIAVVDHVSSVPSVINPLDRLIPFIKSEGIQVLVDGAHAIGQVPIDLGNLGPDYYVTDAHKWFFVPRPVAIMYVGPKHTQTIHPAITSYNYDPRGMRFQDEFFWTGTVDHAPILTLPAAIEFRQSLGGEAAIREYNHNLARVGGRIVADALGTSIIQEDDQFGNAVDIKLPILVADDPTLTPCFWQETLLLKHSMFAWAHHHGGSWCIRLAANVFNHIGDFEKAAHILVKVCLDINKAQKECHQCVCPSASVLGICLK